MQIIDNINLLTDNIRLQLPNAISFIAIIWIIHLINIASGMSLNILGIIPRKIYGLTGIFLSPLLHQNFDHLFFNSIPLIVLSTILLTNGLSYAIYITLGITILSGILTWLFARKAIHIGASGLIMGYMGFFISRLYYHKTQDSLIIGFVVFYYLGSLLFSIFPEKDNVSFEGHIFGLISGLIMSSYYNDYLFNLSIKLTPQVNYVFQTIQASFI